MMEPARLIAGLREGAEPSAADLHAFAAGLADGTVSDAQAGAFAMAVCLKGLSEPARVALTLAMRDSGQVIEWDLPGPVMDKHSTGGIGDCVSLVLAPALAACGVFVPMISGRGLGHTGGTLDKLEAIPGLNTSVSEERFRDMTARLGCAIVSAGPSMAPADRRLYAIRDVTGTVESIDLITASILSKKLAAGLDALVLDVKCGSGAFMKTLEQARALARSLVDTANGAGCATTALITHMSAPIAPYVGNALEVGASVDVLTGAARGPLFDLTLDLGEQLLVQGGSEDGRAQIERALTSGAAAERFARMIAALGGTLDLDRDWRAQLPAAAVVGDVTAPHEGTIVAVDGTALGQVVVRLGGGRRVETDRIAPSVGLSNVAAPGMKLAKGDPLATIHAANEEAAQEAAHAVRAAFTWGEAAAQPPLILEKVS